MPYTTRADGDVITASSWNATVRDQVISTVTSATNPAGTEGQVIVETDTDLLKIHTGSAFTQFGSYGAWTSYTPTLTQSATVTKTVTYARYWKSGRLVVVEVNLAMTSAGTANNGIAVTLPIAAATTGLWVGSGIFYDQSGGVVYPFLVAVPNTTYVEFTDSTTSTTVNIYLGQSGSAFAAAAASGDVISFNAIYEGAS